MFGVCHRGRFIVLHQWHCADLQVLPTCCCLLPQRTFFPSDQKSQDNIICVLMSICVLIILSCILRYKINQLRYSYGYLTNIIIHTIQLNVKPPNWKPIKTKTKTERSVAKQLQRTVDDHLNCMAHIYTATLLCLIEGKRGRQSESLCHSSHLLFTNIMLT